MPDFAGPLVQNAPAAPAVDFVTVPDLAARDNASNVASLRVGAIVRVVSDGNYYQLLTTAPTWNNLGPSVIAAAGDFQVVADTTARDALSPNQGERVRVLSISQVQEWDGTAWQTVEKGNPLLLGLLTSGSDLIDRYVNGDTGNDETGDGLTPGTAWATTQRAVDEVPSEGCSGSYNVRVAGATAQEIVDMGHVRSSPDFLGLSIIGEQVSIETISITGNTGLIANPTDPNGGDFHSVINHTATPWATSIDEEVHWLSQELVFGAGSFPLTAYPVGTSGGGTTHESNNVTGSLLLLTAFAQSGDWELHAFTTQIVRKAGASTMRQLNPNVAAGVTLSYTGCIFNDATFITLENVNLFACRFDSIADINGEHFSSGVVTTTRTDYRVQDGRNSSFNGVIANGALTVGSTQNNGRFGTVGPLLLRDRRSGDSRKLLLGRVTISNLDYIDVVGEANGSPTLGSIAVTDTVARCADQSGIACENNQGTVMAMTGKRTRMRTLGRFFGECSGICFKLADGASVDNTSGLLNQLTSVLGATSQVQMRVGDPSFAFPTITPLVELLEGTRCDL